MKSSLFSGHRVEGGSGEFEEGPGRETAASRQSSVSIPHFITTAVTAHTSPNALPKSSHSRCLWTMLYTQHWKWHFKLLKDYFLDLYEYTTRTFIWTQVFMLGGGIGVCERMARAEELCWAGNYLSPGTCLRGSCLSLNIRLPAQTL